MQQYRKNLGKVSLTAEGAWNLDNNYDILSIVYDEHTQHSFISRKAVPQGVDLYNKEYWMPLNVSGYADNNVIILSKKTSEASIQSYTLEEAISSIKSVGRRPGAILGFYNENNDRLDIGGRWELWQFNDTNIFNWENADSWQNLYYNYNKFMGWFKDKNFLTKYAPFPEIGCYAFVGSEFNEATVYRCDNKYVWNNTTQHARDYVKVIVDGNVSVGENGNWFNNGEDTGIPASVKGENGKTPVFREKDNTIQYSFDNVNWITISDKVAAWFRWNATTGDTQANNVGRIQISRDNVTWTNLSGDIINNLHISRYIGADETLPTSGIVEGTIYAKGPTYDTSDTSHANPIYRLWVYAWKGNTLAWQDNGEFTSIAAGVVQETGDSETEVMSQKAVTEKLSELGSEVAKLGSPIGSTFKYESKDSSLGMIPFFAKAGDSVKIVVNGSIEWSRLIITYNEVYTGSNNRLLDSNINEIVKGEEYIATIPKDIESVGLGYIDKTSDGDITISFSVVNNTIKQLSDSIENTNNLFNSFIEGNSVYESDNSSLGIISFFGKAGDVIKITVDGTVEWEQLIVTYNGLYTGGTNQLLNSNTKEIIKGEEYIVTLLKDIESVGLGYIKKSLEGNIAIRFVNEGSVQSIKKKLSNQIITETYLYYSSTAEKGMLECNIKKGDYISIKIAGTVEWSHLILTYNGLYAGGNNQLVNTAVYENVHKNQKIEIFATKDMQSIGLGYISKINNGDIGIEFRVCRIDVNNIYSGKNFTFFGSSITEGGAWCQYISDFLHANYFNCGVGGSRISNAGDASMCRMERLNGTYTPIKDPNNPSAVPSPAKAVLPITDILFIEGGVNDWAWNVELGDRTINYNESGIVADTYKYYDACHQMFVNISNHIPNSEVVVVGDVFGKLSNRGYFQNEYGIVNDKGLQLTDYADILVDVAGMHGHLAFNMGREAGVNNRNVLKMGDGLHPNVYHASVLARIVIEHLLRQPL